MGPGKSAAVVAVVAAMTLVAPLSGAAHAGSYRKTDSVSCASGFTAAGRSYARGWVMHDWANGQFRQWFDRYFTTRISVTVARSNTVTFYVNNDGSTSGAWDPNRTYAYCTR